MTIRFDKQTIQEKLETAVRFSSSRVGSSPLLQSVKIEIENNKISFFSTNLNSYYLSNAPIKAEIKISLLIEPRKIIEFLSLLSPGEVEGEIGEKGIMLSQKGVSGEFLSVKGSDFPQAPQIEGKGEVVNHQLLNDLLPLILFTAAKEETRPVLNGINFSYLEGVLSIVSTDGFRLSLVQQKTESKIPSLIIPSLFLVELLRETKGAEEVRFLFSEKEKIIRFIIGESQYMSRVIEGEFPPFQKVIPTEVVTEATVDKDEFLRACKIVSVFAKEYSNIALCTFLETGVRINPKQEAGEKNSVIIEGKRKGPEQTAAFNLRFLLDYLQHAKGKKIHVGMVRSEAPVAFREEGNSAFLHIIMPVRVQQ